MYEERLSMADNRRYEMEDLIASLEEQLSAAQARPPSPTSAARYASSAAEIDNETLRIQVQHLQKKISSLEDLVEDARATAEKEELSANDRLIKYKEREDELRKEVTEGHKEIQRVLKGEEQARARVEEIEEALRENTAALENARAEVENLRTEIAVSLPISHRQRLVLMDLLLMISIWKVSLQVVLLAVLRNPLNSCKRSLSFDCSWQSSDRVLVPMHPYTRSRKNSIISRQTRMLCVPLSYCMYLLES